MLDIVLEDLRQKDGTEDQKQAAMNALFNLWNPREPESRQRALHWLTIQDLHQKQTVSSEQPRPDNEEIVESAEEDIAGGEESDFEGFGEVSEGKKLDREAPLYMPPRATLLETQGLLTLLDDLRKRGRNPEAANGSGFKRLPKDELPAWVSKDMPRSTAFVDTLHDQDLYFTDLLDMTLIKPIEFSGSDESLLYGIWKKWNSKKGETQFWAMRWTSQLEKATRIRGLEKEQEDLLLSHVSAIDDGPMQGLDTSELDDLELARPRPATVTEDGETVQVDLGHGFVVSVPADKEEHKKEVSALRSQGTKVLPYEIYEVVQAIHKAPRNNMGASKKKWLAQKYSRHLKQRGSIAADSTLRDYTPEELGMHKDLLRHFSTTSAHKKNVAGNLPNAKVDGQPMQRCLREAEQSHSGPKSNVKRGTFGKSKDQPSGENPFLKDTGSLNAKAAIFFALKQSRLTSADLNMERVGIMWKKLSVAACAILERQVEQEAYGEEQRHEMHNYISHYKNIANDYREVALKKHEALEKVTKILEQQKHADATALGEVVKLKGNQNMKRYKPQHLDRRSKAHRDRIKKILEQGTK